MLLIGTEIYQNLTYVDKVGNTELTLEKKFTFLNQ